MTVAGILEEVNTSAPPSNRLGEKPAPPDESAADGLRKPQSRHREPAIKRVKLRRVGVDQPFLNQRIDARSDFAMT
jgi:hypothetical protein